LKELNLPEYSFRIVEHEGTMMILDAQRRKFVKLTPEEWVRQNFVQYLIREAVIRLDLSGSKSLYYITR